MIEFIVKFQNQLSMSQVSVLVNKTISHFGPCKPTSISVSAASSTCKFEFMQDCITAEELKTAVDKTLESARDANPVSEIKKNGEHIWPVTN